jgi:hypothetical protein
MLQLQNGEQLTKAARGDAHPMHRACFRGFDAG